jgi:hypothetical protein
MPDLAGRGLIDLDVLEPAEACALFADVVGQRRAEAARAFRLLGVWPGPSIRLPAAAAR